MRPCRSRARKPVTSESSMALRKAKASARSRSARWRRRMSRANKANTVTNASDKPSTKAVSKLGNQLGEARQLSKRSTKT